MVDSVNTATIVRSPFDGYPLGVRADRSGAVGVKINTGTMQSVTQISTWASGIPALLSAIGSAFGTAPARPGMAIDTALGFLMRTGPEEFLLIGSARDGCNDMTTELRRAVGAHVGSVTDLSHARCYIHIEGPQCRSALGKLFALDLRESTFPIGEIRLTGTHHVPCILHRLGADAFNMLVYSTYAYDQLATVMDAALEYGVALKAIA